MAKGLVSSPPAASGTAAAPIPEGMAVVAEGSASILMPKDKVFYNPVQQFNRDLSIVGIRAWSNLHLKARKRSATPKPAEPDRQPKKARVDDEQDPARYLEILEALSASGLRAIRYAAEIPTAKSVLANDFSAAAVESIRSNAQFSNVAERVAPVHGDANVLMYSRKTSPVHVVDLDPYGSATPFLDAAVQALVSDGLLLVTCTDLAVLAGNGYPEKCFALYGGQTLYSDARHESALRLVLATIANTAARYGLAIEPQLSLSIDFYVRLFVKVKRSPQTVKLNASKTISVAHCRGCGATFSQPLGKATPAAHGSGFKFGYARITAPGSECPHCRSSLVVAGPMWGAPIHNPAFIDEMLAVHGSISGDAAQAPLYGTLPRIQGMLSAARNELPEIPFYVNVQSLASTLRASSPPHKVFLSALCNAGYRVSYTHAQAGAIKTDAPHSVLLDIMKAWVIKDQEGKVSKNLKPGSPGYAIMQDPQPSQAINFEMHPRALELEEFRKSKLVRYQVNPTKNWGPKAKASG